MSFAHLPPLSSLSLSPTLCAQSHSALASHLLPCGSWKMLGVFLPQGLNLFCASARPSLPPNSGLDHALPSRALFKSPQYGVSGPPYLKLESPYILSEMFSSFPTSFLFHVLCSTACTHTHTPYLLSVSLKAKKKNFFFGCARPFAGILPNQGSLNPFPLQWRRGALPTGQPGNSQNIC